MPLPAHRAQWVLRLAEEPVEQTGSGRRTSDRPDQKAWKESGRVYGYRKLHDDLLDQGETSCVNRIARLAKLAGIKAQIGYKRRPGSYRGKPSVVVDNTLARQFDVDAPDKAWVTDITHVSPAGQWMSRRGNCHDNAVAESFFNLLKRERIRRRTYRTREEARQDVFDYIEMFYNPKRKHVRNGMLSPVDFERQQKM